jgi:hypothetical protein
MSACTHDCSVGNSLIHGTQKSEKIDKKTNNAQLHQSANPQFGAVNRTYPLALALWRWLSGVCPLKLDSAAF